MPVRAVIALTLFWGIGGLVCLALSFLLLFAPNPKEAASSWSLPLMFFFSYLGSAVLSGLVLYRSERRAKEVYLSGAVGTCLAAVVCGYYAFRLMFRTPASALETVLDPFIVPLLPIPVGLVVTAVYAFGRRAMPAARPVARVVRPRR